MLLLDAINKDGLLSATLLSVELQEEKVNDLKIIEKWYIFFSLSVPKRHFLKDIIFKFWRNVLWVLMDGNIHYNVMLTTKIGNPTSIELYKKILQKLAQYKHVLISLIFPTSFITRHGIELTWEFKTSSCRDWLKESDVKLRQNF